MKHILFGFLMTAAFIFPIFAEEPVSSEVIYIEEPSTKNSPEGVQKGIIVIINLLEKFANPFYLNRYALQRMRKQFPFEQAIFITPKSHTDLLNALSKIIKKGWPIQSLLIMGHGDLGQIGFDTPEGLIIYHLFSKGDPFEMLKKTFLPKVSIFFWGCNQISKDPPFAYDELKTISKNMGVKDGTIYMNYTPGSNLFDQLIKVPLTEQPTIRTGIAAFTNSAGMVLPSILFQTLFMNKGYTFRIQTMGKEREYALYQNNYFNALENSLPESKFALLVGTNDEKPHEIAPVWGNVSIQKKLDGTSNTFLNLSPPTSDFEPIGLTIKNPEIKVRHRNEAMEDYMMKWVNGEK